MVCRMIEEREIHKGEPILSGILLTRHLLRPLGDELGLLDRKSRVLYQFCLVGENVDILLWRGRCVRGEDGDEGCRGQTFDRSTIFLSLTSHNC